MSAALVSKSGSGEALYRSNRWGRRFASRQTRCTRFLVIPSSFASLRQDQWVDPSRGLRPVALRMRARNWAVSFEAGFPGRWVSNPSIPCARKRRFHFETVGREVSSLSATARYEEPAASANTIRARCTKPAGSAGDRAMSWRSARWSDVSRIWGPSKGMLRRRPPHGKCLSATVH